MELRSVEIAEAILRILKDAEFHTITATTFKVGSLLARSEKEKTVRYPSRNKNQNISVSKTMLYTQVQIVVSSLRREKYIQNFPGTKNKGIFAITNKGLILLATNFVERRKTLSKVLTNSKKIKKSAKN